MSAWRGLSLHPDVARAARVLVAALAHVGIRARVTSGYRSLARQQQLYDEYVRGGPLASRPGNSAHNYGLAVDVAVDGAAPGDPVYDDVHAVAQMLGLTPLGPLQRRGDPWHLEVPNWRQYV